MKQTVTYSLYHKQPAANEKLPGVVIDIERFVDERRANQDSLFFKKRPMTKIDGRKVCINAERFYTDVPVNKQVTAMLSFHMRYSHVYDTVITNHKDSADYYITGRLTRFEIIQDFPVEAAVAQEMFGLIGYMATRNVKTQASAIIEIQDLMLMHKDGGQIKNFGNITGTYSGQWPADAECICGYHNIGDRLKDYFEEVSAMVYKEISLQESRKKAIQD